MPKSSFKGFADLTPFDTAMARLGRLKSVVGEETVPLSKALLRINATPIKARFPLPWADNAAVDGYAFNFAAAEADCELPLGGRLAIGEPPPTVGVRQVWAVATGSAVPPPLDTVVMEEHCHLNGDRLRLPATRTKGSNLRKCGEDIKKGQLAIAPGCRLRPQELAMAAALGVAKIAVKKPLKLGLISSGNELQEPRTALVAGKLYDANRPSLTALARLGGIEVADYGIVGDDRGAVAKTLRRAAECCQAVVISGGSSSPHQDVVGNVIGELGKFHFQKCAVKPGRPFAFAELGRTPIFNLPGNVVAANVIFMMMVKPTLAKLGGATVLPIPRFSVTATFAAAKKGGRREWLRGILTLNAKGEPSVRRGAVGAGILSSLTAADGLIELDENVTRVERGQAVSFIPFSSLW